MLRVVHGPFHPNLEQAFVSRLRELRAGAAGPVAVVAPSRRMADKLQRLVAVEAGLPLLDVHFHTFFSLAEALVSREGGPRGRLVADPVLHDRVVDALLEEEPAFGALFGGEARPRALAGALRASLRDLIDAGVCAEHVEEHFGAELLADKHERDRLLALLRLAQAYELKLEALGILSPSGLTRAAAQAAAGPEGAAWLASFREILYYGFYDLTGLQLEFFEAVGEQAAAALFFPYRRGHPAFRFADALFEQKLLRYEISAAPPSAALPAMAEALDVLFGAGPAGRAPQGVFELLSASGARDEAWAAAKEILSLVESGFCRFEDIGVVARSLESHRAALAEVFAENAIPCDLGAGEPLLRRPAAKFALNLLLLARRDFPAAVVADLAGAPYFARRPSARVLRHWRAIVERLGIHAGWLQWRKLEAYAGRDLELFAESRRDGGAGYQVPAEDIDSLWRLVSGWQAELTRGPDCWSAHSQRAVAVLERDFALPADASAEESEAAEAVLEAARSLAAFDVLGGTPSWDDFLEAFEDKLRRASLEPARRRGVRLLGAMDARGESFEALFLLGLKEKLFPRPIQEDPILRETARAALRHPGGYWIAPKAAGYEEERLLFYLMAAAARRRLYCVFPRSDEAGKAEVPSLYLRELCRAAGRQLSEARRVPRLPLEKLASVAPPLLSPREASLALACSGGPAARYQDAVGGEGRWLSESLRSLQSLNRRGAAGEHDGVIGPPQVFIEQLRLYGMSPSAFDALARCPFQFFARRLLGLGRRQEASEAGELAAWMRGQIYHAVLEKFYGGLPPEFWEAPAGDWRPALTAALTEVFAVYGWRELGVYPLLWRSVRDTMTARTRAFAERDVAETRESGLRPLWLEKALEASLPDGLPGLAGGLKIRGRLDRLDASPAKDRFRVVDYKTRWTPRAKLATLVAQGELHQLPLYAELAAQALGGGARLESARLYAIEDSPQVTGRVSAHVYDGAQWEEGRGAFFAALSSRIEELAQGRFPISPDDSEFGHCGRCDFGSMCRKSHGPTRARSTKKG